MHSRIIQIEMEPFAPEEILTEADIPEWFLKTAADYTMAVESREEEIKYLLSRLPNVIEPGSEPNSFVLLKGGKCEYFKTRFDEFRQVVEAVSGLTLEAFAGCDAGSKGLSAEAWMGALKSLFCNEYSVYVYCDYELVPLDEWMRNASEDTTYYIGGVLDYHF